MPRILLVPDDAELRRVLQEAMPYPGLEVRASRPDEAVEAMPGFLPDLVIAGLSNEGKTGLDLLARVSARHPGVPVAVIADPGERHHVVAALRAGAYDSLVRPVEPPQLRTLVRASLGGRYPNEDLPCGVTLMDTLGFSDLSSEGNGISYVMGAKWMPGVPSVLRLGLHAYSFGWDSLDSYDRVLDWTPDEGRYEWISDEADDPLPERPTPPYLVTSAGGRYGVTVTSDGLMLKDRSTGTLREIPAPPRGEVAFSHDERILFAETDAGVLLWRCDTGDSLGQLRVRGCQVLAVSPNAPLVAACNFAEIVVWRYDTTVLLAPPPAPETPLAMLAAGVKQWNGWRTRYPSVAPRLGAVNCSLRDLSGINLRGAGLARAVLRRTALRDADLREADLRFSDLRDADLRGARLANADLSEALMSGALLDGADLSGAHLFRTDLTGAELNGTDLSGAVAGWTMFGNNDLSGTTGLDLVRHERPSMLGLDTLRTLPLPLPLEFLRGCGLSEGVIRTLPQLLAADAAVEYHYCFISYDHRDGVFAQRLHDRLQQIGIRCYLDRHSMLPGEDVHEALASAIRDADRMLLCASRASLTSWWVESEIGMAFQKEQRLSREHGRRVSILIPLDLDGYLFSDECTGARALEIRSRLAADFRGWQSDDTVFEEQLARVVKALRVDRSGGAAPSR